MSGLETKNLVRRFKQGRKARFSLTDTGRALAVVVMEVMPMASIVLTLWTPALDVCTPEYSRVQCSAVVVVVAF